MSHTITFDTLKFVKKLKASGITEQQAETQSEAIRDLLSEVQENQAKGFLTKQDIKSLEEKVNKLDGKLNKVESDTKLLKWMLGFIFALLIPIFLKTFL